MTKNDFIMISCETVNYFIPQNTWCIVRRVLEADIIRNLKYAKQMVAVCSSRLIRDDYLSQMAYIMYTGVRWWVSQSININRFFKPQFYD